MVKEEIKNQIINDNSEFFLTCLYKLTAGLRYSGNIYETLMLEFGDKGSQEIQRRIDKAAESVRLLEISVEKTTIALTANPEDTANSKLRHKFVAELKSKRKFLKNLKQDLARHKKGNEEDLEEFAGFMRKYAEKFTDSADSLGEINETLIDIINDAVEKSTFFEKRVLNIVKYAPKILIPIEEYAKDHYLSKAQIIEKKKRGELRIVTEDRKKFIVR